MKIDNYGRSIKKLARILIFQYVSWNMEAVLIKFSFVHRPQQYVVVELTTILLQLHNVQNHMMYKYLLVLCVDVEQDSDQESRTVSRLWYIRI